MLMMNPSGHERWYSLSEVDSASEVHGHLHLKILACASGKQKKISVSVLEARNLGMKQKYVSDPFVHVSLTDKRDRSTHCRTKSVGAYTKEQKKTSIRKTSCPVWNSSFEFFCNASLDDKVIFAEVYDKEKRGQNPFIGEVTIGLESLVVGQQLDRWYPLSPKESTRIKNDFKRRDLGKIRLNVQLFEEQILPWECYVPLVNLLTETVQRKPYGEVNTLSLLEEVMTADRTAIGRALVKLYLSQGMIVNFLDTLTQSEVINTETLHTLFRGNSLATKAVDEFLKVIGIPYLLDTLKPIIDKIYEEKKYCEIDPSKINRKSGRRRSIFQLDDNGVQQKSILYLKSYLVSILDSILESVEQCPFVMTQVFHNLYHAADKRFTGNEQYGKYLAVSSFLFLRFFVPAVLNPKLFGLAEFHPDQMVSRTFTLLAKVMQSIGNFNPGIVKEPWMSPFSDFITEYALKLKTFIDKLVNRSEKNHVYFDKEQSSFQTPLLIKEGQLKKYKIGGKLNNVQWKKYNFSLFNDSIHYSKKYDSQTRKFLLVCRISAVEKVEDSVFGKSNVFQVILDNPVDGSKDIHYLLAKDVNDMAQWISAIRRILPGSSSKEKATNYHPGIYNGQFWNCCKRKPKTDPGCSLTHTIASLNDWQDPVFPEQQAQIIYKQFLLGRDKLKDILVENVEKHSQLTINDEIIAKLCDIERDPFYKVRMNSDSGCDTDIDDDKHFIFPFQLDEHSRTILNVLSVVDALEQRHSEHSTDYCELRNETVESEDEVFSSPATTPFVSSEVDEIDQESTDTSSQ